MKKIRGLQYTIRDVPREMDKLLRERAVRESASLNAVVLDALKASSGLCDRKVEYHDLDALSGTWVDDPAFNEAMRHFDGLPQLARV